MIPARCQTCIVPVLYKGRSSLPWKQRFCHKCQSARGKVNYILSSFSISVFTHTKYMYIYYSLVSSVPCLVGSGKKGCGPPEFATGTIIWTYFYMFLVIGHNDYPNMRQSSPIMVISYSYHSLPFEKSCSFCEGIFTGQMCDSCFV